MNESAVQPTEVTQGVKAKGIPNRYVSITYDITNGTLRTHIARKLLSAKKEYIHKLEMLGIPIALGALISIMWITDMMGFW